MIEGNYIGTTLYNSRFYILESFIESCARFFFCFCIDVCCSTVTASIRRNIRSFCIHIKSIIIHDDCWIDCWYTHFWFLVRSTGKNMVYLVIANWHHYPVSNYPIWDSFVWLMILRLVQGVALAGLPAASLDYLNEEIDSRSVGAATGFYITSNALGGMVGRVMTGYIADHYTWQASFYVLAGIGVVILIAVLLMLPKSRYFKPSDLSLKKDIAGFLVHLKKPLLLPVFGLGIILQLSFTGVWTYLPFYLQGDPFHLSLEAISYMFLAYSLGVIGSPLAGWLAGNFGLKRV